MESPEEAPAAERTLTEGARPDATEAPATEAPGAAAPTGDGAAVPAPAAPVPRVRISSGIKIGIVAALGAALVGGGVAASIALRPLGTDPLPFIADELPVTFGSITRREEPRAYADLARAYSANAARCGGADVFSLAQRVDEFYAVEELAALIRDVDRTSAYLRCGRHIQASASATYELELDGGESLAMFRTQAEKLRLDGSFVSRAHTGFSALWCGAAEGAPCGFSLGAGRLAGEPYWVFGNGKTLEAYGAAVTGEEKIEPRDLDKIDELADLVKPYRESRIGGPKGTFAWDVFGVFPLWSKDLEGARKTFESRLKELRAYWATGAPSDLGGEARLEILADNGPDARELLSALRDYRSALRHADLDELPIYGPVTWTRYARAMAEMGKRALSDADPVRENERVSWVVRLDALPEEGADLYAFEVDLAKRNRPLATLVFDLLEGRDPDEATLRGIGGRRLWEAVEMGLRNKAGRIGPPPAEEVPDLADVPVPGGGKLTRSVPTSGSLDDGRARYEYEADPEEAVLIVNEAKHLLREAGWTVTLDGLTSGPSYVCERDARRLGVVVQAWDNTLQIAYKPLL